LRHCSVYPHRTVLKGRVAYETHASSVQSDGDFVSAVDRPPLPWLLIRVELYHGIGPRQLSILSFSSRTTHESTNASANAAVAVAGKRKSWQ
jgi:hypothetical protein